MDTHLNGRYALLTLLFLFGLGPASGLAADASYRLGPGDQISIQVYDEADLSLTLRIDESGVFNYPYLGVIRASGQSVATLEKQITDGLLQDILVNPSVNVSITSYRNFYIGGEIKSPGGYPYRPGLTVQQAITVGGGPTDYASKTKFLILREGRTDPQPATATTQVRPGDTITVLEGLF